MLGQKVLGILVTLVYLSSAHAGIVTKCKSDDSKCALKSAQDLLPVFAAGLPEYNVKILDPITFKKLDASISNLKLVLTDVTVTGLKNTVLKKVKRDKANNKLFIKLVINAQLEGQYEMDGQLMFLTVTGKGPVHATLKQAEFNLDLDMGEKQKNGVTYWEIKEWKYVFNLKDKSDVEFENLFDGNEVLAQAARTVISEQGNDIILEVGPSVFKTVIQEIVNDINSFFRKVPAEELSID